METLSTIAGSPATDCRRAIDALHRGMVQRQSAAAPRLEAVRRRDAGGVAETIDDGELKSRLTEDQLRYCIDGLALNPIPDADETK
jgi:hypothetical protein